MKTLILIISIIFCSCANFEFDQTIEYKINPIVEKHVNVFFNEANNRNINITKNNLIVIVSEFQGPFKSGAGLSSTHGNQKIIFIRIDAINFYGANSEEVENLVFHELGHSLLNRPHTEHYSIMNTGLSLHEYAGKPNIRNFLIDELFMVRTQ